MDNITASIVGGNLCLSKVTLDKNGVGAATFRNTGTINYTVDGIYYTRAAFTAQAFSAGHAALVGNGNNGGRACVFGVWLDAAGNITTTQGPIVNMIDVVNRVTAVPIPDQVPGRTMIGMIFVRTNSSTTFTPGTTALDASGVTTLYYDTLARPSVPLTV